METCRKRRATESNGEQCGEPPHKLAKKVEVPIEESRDENEERKKTRGEEEGDDGTVLVIRRGRRPQEGECCEMDTS
jgi:hypothetical protein